MTTFVAHPPMTPPLAGPAREERYVATRLPVRRFTVDEYHRLIEQGFFAADERFELLEGWIVAKMPRNPVHDAAVDIAEQLLAQLIPGGWYVRGQKALTTIDSEPEPDVVLVRGVPRDYASRHPVPADLALVIEVANTTLADDRDFKGRVYAKAGIATYWIVNLIDRQVEVYTQPTASGGAPAYARREDFVPGQSLSIAVGATTIGPVAVADLLP